MNGTLTVSLPLVRSRPEEGPNCPKVAQGAKESSQEVQRNPGCQEVGGRKEEVKWSSVDLEMETDARNYFSDQLSFSRVNGGRGRYVVVGRRAWSIRCREIWSPSFCVNSRFHFLHHFILHVAHSPFCSLAFVDELLISSPAQPHVRRLSLLAVAFAPIRRVHIPR